MRSEEKREFAPRDRWLMFALILGPSAWLLHLNISYMLVPESCGDGTKLMLHVVAVVCFAGALGAAALAWSIRAKCIGEPDTVLWRERTKWVATFVFVLSLSMALVIVAQEIPNLMLGSCQ